MVSPIRVVDSSSPGSIFVGGEHAVVYFEDETETIGNPSIVASIDYRTGTHAQERDGDLVVVYSNGYGGAAFRLDELKSKQWTVRAKTKADLGANEYKTDRFWPLTPVLDLAATFARDHELRRGFELYISSDIPRDSGGMSSSTAVLCSVYGALTRLYGVDAPAERFFDALLRFQVKVHNGGASGAEIASSSVGGYNRVRKIKNDSGVIRLERTPLGEVGLNLVIADTGKLGETGTAVAKVRAARSDNKATYDGYLRGIREIVGEEEVCLARRDIRRLGDLMDENHRILSAHLDVSSPELEAVVAAAKRAGALGAKLSGGGMGGVAVALAEDSDHRERIAQEIRDAGFKAYITTVGGEGFKAQVIER